VGWVCGKCVVGGTELKVDVFAGDSDVGVIESFHEKAYEDGEQGPVEDD
jgi:hypothetical protein